MSQKIIAKQLKKERHDKKVKALMAAVQKEQVGASRKQSAICARVFVVANTWHSTILTASYWWCVQLAARIAHWRVRSFFAQLTIIHQGRLWAILTESHTVQSISRSPKTASFLLSHTFDDVDGWSYGLRLKSNIAGWFLSHFIGYYCWRVS